MSLVTPRAKALPPFERKDHPSQHPIADKPKVKTRIYRLKSKQAAIV
jgi:hypothetical protein